MMAKKKVVKSTAELRKLAEEKKLFIGTERTIKNLKLGKVSAVYVTKNISDSVLATLTRQATLSELEITKLNATNEELGVICKKPFRISVLSVIKE